MRLAVEIAAGGTLASWRVVADGLVRAWLPGSVVLAVRCRRARPALLVACLAPALVEWRASRPGIGPVTWAALRLADDAAYGVGSWYGALRARRPGVLLRPAAWTLTVEAYDEST